MTLTFYVQKLIGFQSWYIDTKCGENTLFLHVYFRIGLRVQTEISSFIMLATCQGDWLR